MRESDTRDHRTQLYPANARIKGASIHTSHCWYTYIFIWLNELFFFFKCWYYHSSRAMEEEPLLFSTSDFELTVLYANFSCKLCIWITTGHKELKKIYKTNIKKKPTNSLYLACELSHGNPSEISTNECYQDTTQT